MDHSNEVKVHVAKKFIENVTLYGLMVDKIIEGLNLYIDHEGIKDGDSFFADVLVRGVAALEEQANNLNRAFRYAKDFLDVDTSHISLESEYGL